MTLLTVVPAWPRWVVRVMPQCDLAGRIYLMHWRPDSTGLDL